MNTRAQNQAAGAAATDTLDRLLQQVRDWAANEALKYRLRQERRQLAQMSDEMLRDLGVSRGDADAEAARTDVPAARLAFESRK